MKSTYSRVNASEENDDPTLPCDIYRKENIAIIMAYFSVGLTGSFLSTPLNIYLVEVLNAEPQMQNTIGILQTLPWSLKVAFGFLSDAFPINGLHRKPYLAIGAIMYSTAFIAYSVLGKHDVVLLSLSIFLGTIGLIQMDVMADTMCVQRSKFEPEETKGQMQASCYSIRFAGSLLGAIMGATLCNRDSWGWGLSYFQVSFINGVIPFLLVTPWLWTLRERFRKPSPMLKHSLGSAEGLELGVYSSNLPEELQGLNSGYGIGRLSKPHRYDSLESNDNNSSKNSTFVSLSPPPPSSSSTFNSNNSNNNNNEEPVSDESDEKIQRIGEQIHEIWETVQLTAVWRPMCFVYIFNLFQVPNVAWQSYLQLALNFPAWVLGGSVMLGSFMTFAGVLAYKYFFFKSSWRSIYIWTVMLTAFFSMLQLILIFQWNTKYLGLNNYLFSMGDDVISAYISGIQFLPLCIMYMRLCPEGAEGSSYAMLTTFGNIALVCASNLGNQLANVWDVSNTAMRENNVSGLWKLNTLTSIMSILPLSLLFLLPKNAEEQDELAKSKAKSPVAGMIFLIVLFGSLTWSTITAIMRISA